MNIVKLQRKFPILTQEDLFSTIERFRSLDIDDKGWIAKPEALESVSASGEATYDQARQTLKEVEVDASGHVELDDYVELVAKLRDSNQGGGASSSNAAPKTSFPGLNTTERIAVSSSNPSMLQLKGTGAQARIVVGGSQSGTTHTINEEERSEFTKHINSVLAGDSDIGDRLPFPTDTFQLFDECRDGLVLSKLINDSVPDTIDTRVLNWPKNGKSLNNFTAGENANIVINSAKAIGCVVVNVHPEDIIEGKEHLILGLIWQIIRKGLLNKIDIQLHPELYRLLEDDETLEEFLRLAPEKILIRWFNYHLKQAGWERRVTNFSSDIKDGENYTILLNQLAPELCSKQPLQTQDLLTRAEQVLENAEKLDCRKYLTAKALVAGNPKLNLAFVAHLFNTHPGLEPIAEEEKPEIEEFDAEGEREARVFTLWLNSLDVDPPIVTLFEDLKNGLALLQAYEKVMPGVVDKRRINNKPANGNELSRFKALENNNYVVDLGKENKFSLVGIEGADIVDGNKLLTLGLVWQLMRRNIDLTMQHLSKGKTLSDAEILSWAHAQVAKGGKSSKIRNFSDPSLSNAHFLLDVLNGLAPGYVDYDLVTPGTTDEDRYANARLAISIARKLGALIWLVPEDINEVRPRLILTFVASLMALNK
ncbi:Fimbrin, actin-bundling protein [Hanseniaspora osmophila]|uniref:Fimbrin n=1 Tax=Hanseniaspora osmophila TaxID=56408 RepID=A0A1E5RW66_9ASCO|nr:Fimbrin [Hanseniaspora osmophila]